MKTSLFNYATNRAIAIQTFEANRAILAMCDDPTTGCTLSEPYYTELTIVNRELKAKYNL